MRSCIASILLFFCIKADTQLPAEIKFTNYSTVSGLPEINVNNIIQDSRGFLWLGTREGLIRYDGYHFSVWYANQGDPLRFSNNNIRVAGESSYGQVLFLSGADLWTINIYNHKLQKAENFSGKIIIDLPKKLYDTRWAILDTDSLFITNEYLKTEYGLSLKKYFPSGALVSVFPLYHSWILLTAASYNKRFFFNYETKQIVPVQIDDSQIDSRSKLLDPQAFDSVKGRLYLSTYFNGNFYCDLKIPEITSYRPIRLISQPASAVRKSIYIDNNLMVQVGFNGLAITDFSSSVLFTDKTGLDNPPLSNIMVDIYQTKDDNFWLATPKGISRFSLRAPSVKYILLKKGLNADAEIKSIVKGSDGDIYFLNTETGLFRFNRKSREIKNLNNSITYGWSAIVNGDDIIAAGGPKKLLSYNTKSARLFYPSYLQKFYTDNTDLVTLVFKSRNGDLWYSCNGGTGIVRNPSGSSQYIQYNRTSNPPSFSHSYVHGAAEDSHGNIWWCSNKSGMLLKWDATKEKFEEFEISKLIPQFSHNTGINFLYTDAGDNLWIALDGAALLKYNVNEKKGNYYDINSGLPTDAIGGITSDGKKRVWFGTRKGLCCYLPGRDKVVTFTSLDGMPDDDFENNGIFYDKDENLVYAGAKNAIAFFNPDTLLNKTITTQPPVFIDEMKVNGKPFYFEKEKKIVLESNENSLEFSIASPDFNRNSQLQFQYLLKGSGIGWSDIGDNRKIIFNNLSSGSYTISVRCKYKGNETWNETTSPLSFIIKTPWQKTFWFRLIVALLAAGLVFYLIRDYYRRKLEKQKAESEKKQAIEKERTRIATDMHDDFGASLSRIKFISEKMQLTQKENETLKTDLSKISEYSDEMAEKMNEIVWALNQRYDSCEDLVSFCRSYASEYFLDKNILFSFTAGPIPDKKIQGEVRRNIFLVIKEALNNIVKHAAATEASVSFSFEKGIAVTIADNGKGFEPKNVRPFANGLENMKKRITDINGQLDISSKNGTLISFTVPI